MGWGKDLDDQVYAVGKDGQAVDVGHGKVDACVALGCILNRDFGEVDAPHLGWAGPLLMNLVCFMVLTLGWLWVSSDI